MRLKIVSIMVGTGRPILMLVDAEGRPFGQTEITVHSGLDEISTVTVRLNIDGKDIVLEGAD